ncbi:MAG: glycosyltransferase [Pseudohongiellaceae bacterium]|nr:glycosyltransferase [Pseudohongiellaceae bacterium]
MTNKAKKASIDIIIVNYHSADDTGAAIAALYPWPYGKIIVVDNSADGDATAKLEKVLEQFPNTLTVIAQENLGFANGCNLAFDRSQSEHILLLNPDASISTASIIKMSQTLSAQPNAAAVTPNIFWDKAKKFFLPTALPPTPLAQCKSALAFRFPTIGRYLGLRYCRQQRRMLRNKNVLNVPFVTGAILLLKREAISKAKGLFDPRFFMFYEDSDLSLRLRHCGFKLLLDTQAEGQHSYRHKSYKLPMMEQTRAAYFDKNYPRLTTLGNWLKRQKLVPRVAPWEDWKSLATAPVASLEQLAEELGEAPRIVALSPSPAMVPSLISVNEHGTLLDEKDWECLEPGRYMAYVRLKKQHQGAFWLTINKA